MNEWTAHRRVFDVDSDGELQLTEQWFAGWRARIDGASAVTFKCNTAFVCVTVPRGSHRVEFYFVSDSLRSGSIVSLVSLLILGYWARRHATSARPFQSP